PTTLSSSATVREAAQAMKDLGIGDVVVVQGDALCGVVTDRDLVVRAMAEDLDPSTTTVGEVCTPDPMTLAPDDPVEKATRLMREQAVRRIPVVENGRPVGIVSIGDLAVELDAESALAFISAAPANN
ncbi:MAG TPA: CBS domain-containing protein, partial [Acidimicrobiales bacterium]|nr:CBS domain-containing protein [Acidimicrobiales bacterium]